MGFIRVLPEILAGFFRPGQERGTRREDGREVDEKESESKSDEKEEGREGYGEDYERKRAIRHEEEDDGEEEEVEEGEKTIFKNPSIKDGC